MTSLTDGTEQLTANIVFTGAAIAHHALAGADHRDSHAVEDLGKLADGAVHPAAGLALAIDHVDHLFAIAGVLQPHADLRASETVLGSPEVDETFRARLEIADKISPAQMGAVNAAITQLYWTQVSLILLVIIATVIVSEWVSAKVRHAIS